MSKLFLAAPTLPRLSAQRVALVALCVVAGVALAASAAAVVAAAAPGWTIQVINSTGSELVNNTVPPFQGSWQPPVPPVALANGASAVWVAQPGDPGRNETWFGGTVTYRLGSQGVNQLEVNAQADFEDPLFVSCYSSLPAYTCHVQDAGRQTPWMVTFAPVSGDATPPAVQVRVAPSLVEESVRGAGVPVVVRSNEPARARVELIAQNGARHGVLARTLKWANRAYPLMLQLNRAGLRALDVGTLYRLRVQVTDRGGNRAQTIERRVAIR